MMPTGPANDGVPETPEMTKARVRAEAWENRKRNYIDEFKVPDDFRARNEVTADVPPADLVRRIYLLTWHKDRPVVVRAGDGPQPWEVPTLEREAPAGKGNGKSSAKSGTSAIDRWIKREARDQWGIRVKDWFQHSRFELVANVDATSVPPGTLRYELFVCATASRLDDLPDDSDWSRRTITRRDFVQILREGYAGIDEILDAAHDAYLVAQAKQG
jgi:hypothetical protein